VPPGVPRWDLAKLMDRRPVAPDEATAHVINLFRSRLVLPELFKTDEVWVHLAQGMLVKLPADLVVPMQLPDHLPIQQL
jgi:hypothetical protein